MSMAINYMDYGYFEGQSVPSLTPIPETTTQVYQATHREGRRLPYRYRSFISFSYGGRNIEDFNLIATIDGDRISRNVSADFEDLTSSSDVVNGQFYHGTHYRTNTLSLTLSTDTIDQQMLEDFRNWFRGGTARPLILAEHPNREIIARVAQPPEINMLPFEKEVTFNIAGVDYTTSVTEWKGDITLDFVMDEPFWYSKVNIFGKMNGEPGEEVYVDSWEGVAIFDTQITTEDSLKDVLKMIYEDGIPISSMISEPMLLGDEIYAAKGNAVISAIATPVNFLEQSVTLEQGSDYGTFLSHVNVAYDEESGQVKTITSRDPGYHVDGGTPVINDPNDPEDDTYYFPIDEADQDPDNPPENPYFPWFYGAVIEEDDVTTPTNGTIFGPFIKSAESGLDFPPMRSESDVNAFNLYYAGTAPSPVILKFSVPILLDENDGYITSIANYKKPRIVGTEQYKYNSMFLESRKKQEMRFTTPNFLTSYNKIIELFSNDDFTGNGKSWEKLREEIRDKIRHPKIRALGMSAIQAIGGNNQIITQDSMGNQLVGFMMDVFPDDSRSRLEVTINSKTGEATGKYYYKDWVSGAFSNATLEENIGDMINSNHLILEDRNYFQEGTYSIVAWTENAPQYSYRLYHNFPQTLKNFSIRYKYMYF